MTMVTSFKLNDLVFTRIPPCKPDRRHHSFCTRTGKPDLLHKPVVFDDQFSQFIFQSCRCSKAHSILHYLSDFLSHFCMVVAQYQRSPASTKVYELISVSIPDKTTITLLDEQRCTVHRFKS